MTSPGRISETPTQLPSPTSIFLGQSARAMNDASGCAVTVVVGRSAGVGEEGATAVGAGDDGAEPVGVFDGRNGGTGGGTIGRGVFVGPAAGVGEHEPMAVGAADGSGVMIAGVLDGGAEAVGQGATVGKDEAVAVGTPDGIGATVTGVFDGGTVADGQGAGVALVGTGVSGGGVTLVTTTADAAVPRGNERVKISTKLAMATARPSSPMRKSNLGSIWPPRVSRSALYVPRRALSRLPGASLPQSRRARSQRPE